MKVSVTLSVDSEVQQLVQGALQIVKDKNGGTSVLLADALPLAVSIGQNYQALAQDYKSADDIAYIVDQVAKALGLGA